MQGDMDEPECVKSGTKNVAWSHFHVGSEKEKLSGQQTHRE